MDDLTDAETRAKENRARITKACAALLRATYLDAVPDERGLALTARHAGDDLTSAVLSLTAELREVRRGTRPDARDRRDMAAAGGIAERDLPLGAAEAARDLRVRDAANDTLVLAAVRTALAPARGLVCPIAGIASCPGCAACICKAALAAVGMDGRT